MKLHWTPCHPDLPQACIRAWHLDVMFHVGPAFDLEHLDKWVLVTQDHHPDAPPLYGTKEHCQAMAQAYADYLSANLTPSSL